jgi:hypothetical protein
MSPSDLVKADKANRSSSSTCVYFHPIYGHVRKRGIEKYTNDKK